MEGEDTVGLESRPTETLKKGLCVCVVVRVELVDESVAVWPAPIETLKIGDEVVLAAEEVDVVEPEPKSTETPTIWL